MKGKKGHWMKLYILFIRMGILRGIKLERLEDVFNFKYSPSSISKITDEILEEVEKFKKR